jgi:hypothetical protein
MSSFAQQVEPAAVLPALEPMVAVKESSSTAFFFDPTRLSELAARHAKDYRSAEPFPHIVIDNFLPPKLLDQVRAEFPRPDEVRWNAYYHPNSKKLATRNQELMGPTTRQLFSELNSAAFVDFLAELTDIPALLPDPHLEGGGLHLIERGGMLKIHADFNVHERLKVDRRLNLLLYLNQDWKEEYGGHLELWTRDMKRQARRVLPVFNRCVIFSTTDTSYHGHPEPLTCPPTETRKSLALYYYSAGRPEEERSESHSTLYQRRPGEKVRGDLAIRVLRPLLPPIAVEAAKSALDWGRWLANRK